MFLVFLDVKMFLLRTSTKHQRQYQGAKTDKTTKNSTNE
jgi:hypothetical protein